MPYPGRPEARRWRRGNREAARLLAGSGDCKGGSDTPLCTFADTSAALSRDRLANVTLPLHINIHQANAYGYTPAISVTSANLSTAVMPIQKPLTVVTVTGPGPASTCRSATDEPGYAHRNANNPLMKIQKCHPWVLYTASTSPRRN